MGERLEKKIERLNQLEHLLLMHPQGLTKAEIARRLQVHRSTVAEYLDDLGALNVPIYEPTPDNFAINRELYQVRVQLTQHESMALHLAARLFATRTDKHNPHAASALRKLGISLEKLAPLVSQHLALSADVLDDERRRRDPVFMQVLETLTRAWSLSKKVKLTHQMEGGKVFEYDFAPYFIEPYAVGRTTHVIGLREPPNAIKTLKLERIRTITLLEKSSYTIPDDFDPREKLKDAWGIWYTESEPQEVVLQFSRQVASRVRETQWHHTETVTEEKDGSLIWRAEIAEWKEMVNWVRGWGADCEVVEPKALRDNVIEDVRRAGMLYNSVKINNSPIEGDYKSMDIFQQFLTLPGKTEPPLTIFEHSGDVYQVALYLLDENATSVKYVHLVKAGALLHDVGKIEQDVRAGHQWKHQPYSAKYLDALLEHPRMKSLLADNQIEMNQVMHDDLLLICEHHHDLSTQPAFLRRVPEAMLVSVADALASSLEAGLLGEIRSMLRAGTFIDLNISLLENRGMANGLDGEIHRVDLPGDSTSDGLLNDLIFRDMTKRLGTQGLKPILQKCNSLWVVGALEQLQAFLENYQVNPQVLYESAGLDDEIYEQVLAQLPSPGALSADSLKYVLVNEHVARKVALAFIDRKRAREALEHFDISVHQVHEVFGTRGHTILDKLQAVGENPRYLLTGAQAAYRYHQWRTPPTGHFEILVAPDDFEPWYAYLRNRRTYVGQVWLAGKEHQRFAEVVLLYPSLTDELWDARIIQNGLAFISPSDLIFRLLQAGAESDLAEIIAILIRQHQTWDWQHFADETEKRRLPRQMGCLLEIVNYEAKKEMFPDEVIARLASKVRDTIGETQFIFPKTADETIVVTLPAEYLMIGRKWGLDLRLAPHIPVKVLDDLGV